MTTAIQRWKPHCTAVALLCACSLAGATIKTGTGFELVLTVLDQTNAKMSYTLDLGIDANTFWVQAQQDTGASFFKTIDPATDSAFNTFISAATLSTTRWMVTGTFVDAPLPADYLLYTTQTNNGSVATQTKYFDKSHAVDSAGNFALSFGVLKTYFGNLNISSTGGAILQSTHNTQADGSSVASKTAGNTSTYAAKITGFGVDGGGVNDGDCVVNASFCAGNPLGVSSWFYKVSPLLLEGEVDSGPVIIDEFDNLTADGYWGLIKDPNSSKYILSYTLNGANPKTLVSTDVGRARQSVLDYSAQSGAARLIGISLDDVALQSAVTAVPEPQSWGLMLAGLGALAALRARRSRRAGH